MVNEWTRADLPGSKALERGAEDNDVWITSYGAAFVLDAVVEHLNRAHPKPEPMSADSTYGIPREDYAYVDWPATCAAANERADRAESEVDRWRRAHEIVEQERDLARGRCRELERERDAAVRRGELKARTERDLAEAAEADRDEWKARAEKAATVIDGLKLALANRTSRAEAAEARTAPAVTREEVEKVVRGQWGGCFDGLTDAVWSLVSGADPAVHVVRESDLPEVENKGDGGWDSGGQWYPSHATTEVIREIIARSARNLVNDLAVARAIEAGQATDPVEVKARELWEFGRGMSVCIEFDDIAPDHRGEYLRIARHVLGQEAGQ